MAHGRERRGFVHTATVRRLARWSSVSLGALSLTVSAVTGTHAIRVHPAALDELIRRGGGEAISRQRDQRVDTLRGATRARAIPGGTWIVATTGAAPVQTAIAGGLRQALPLEILSADAADSRLLGLRLVVESRYDDFRFDRAAGRFETVVQVGLLDTIANETARIGRPVLVQIAGSEASFVEPTEFFLDHAGPPLISVRLADSTARTRLRLSLRSEFDGRTYEFGIPFEEPARISLTRDRLAGFGFGSTEVIVEAPQWADSTPIRVRAGRGVVWPASLLIQGGVARARLLTRLSGFDSVTAAGAVLAPRSAYLHAVWPADFLPWALAGALAGGAYAATRMRRARRSVWARFAAAAVPGVASGAFGVALLQLVPLAVSAALVTAVFAAAGGVVGPPLLERHFPPPPPSAPRSGPSHLRKWEVESSVATDDEGTRG